MEKDGKRSKSPSDFWDISLLVPPRGTAYQRPRARDVEAVEITAPAIAPQKGNGSALPHGVNGRAAQNGTNGRAVQGDGAKGAADKTAEPCAPVTLMSATGTVMAGDVPLPRQYVSPALAREEEQRPVPQLVYRPEGALLREVRIYPHKNEYGYYADFCRHARRLLPLEGKECAPVSFFSYMPQYSQLSRAQLGYYLWWRTSFRRGVALDADFSYLLLYLYEIINAGDAIDPAEGQACMLRLWLSYRERHPRLDVLLREWLVDHALLYQLPPPELPRAQFGELVSGCRLKEFYVSAAEGDVMTDAVLLFCSNYDYKKSKFYRGDAIPQFDRVLRGAVREALAFLEAEDAEKSPRVGGYSTITRDTFSGAICAYQQKKRIEVDFASFSHTYELRYIVTDVLKYAENALRAVLGVKSRLTVYEVSRELRERLDAYLATALPKKEHPKRAAAREEEPVYLQRYEQPVAPISLARAAEIEAASWQTTKRLVEAFAAPEAEVKSEKRSEIEREGETAPIAEKSTPLPQFCDKNTANSPKNGTEAQLDDNSLPSGACAALPAQHAPLCVGVSGQSDGESAKGVPCDDVPLAAALGALAGFVALAATADRAGQRAFATAHGMMVDAVADKINTAAGDILGDIILEDVGGAYAVIEDYRELLQREGILP